MFFYLVRLLAGAFAADKADVAQQQQQQASPSVEMEEPRDERVPAPMAIKQTRTPAAVDRGPRADNARRERSHAADTGPSPPRVVPLTCENLEAFNAFVGMERSISTEEGQSQLSERTGGAFPIPETPRRRRNSPEAVAVVTPSPPPRPAAKVKIYVEQPAASSAAVDVNVAPLLIPDDVMRQSNDDAGIGPSPPPPVAQREGISSPDPCPSDVIGGPLLIPDDVRQSNGTIGTGPSSPPPVAQRKRTATRQSGSTAEENVEESRQHRPSLPSEPKVGASFVPETPSSATSSSDTAAATPAAPSRRPSEKRRVHFGPPQVKWFHKTRPVQILDVRVAGCRRSDSYDTTSGIEKEFGSTRRQRLHYPIAKWDSDLVKPTTVPWTDAQSAIAGDKQHVLALYSAGTMVKTAAKKKDGGIVHCCRKVDSRCEEKEAWVRAPYLDGKDDGREVGGVFVYLPVAIIRQPSDGQGAEDDNVYARPGGGSETLQAGQEEDRRLIWEVPRPALFDKMPAKEKGATCDTCRDSERGCSWTPDGLELLCNLCADEPRRSVQRCRNSSELRGFGQFRCASSCGCDCEGIVADGEQSARQPVLAMPVSSAAPPPFLSSPLLATESPRRPGVAPAIAKRRRAPESMPQPTPAMPVSSGAAPPPSSSPAPTPGPPRRSRMAPATTKRQREVESMPQPAVAALGSGDAPFSITHTPVTVQVPAGEGATCDSCGDSEHRCSWTPDCLELFCDTCADERRRSVQRWGSSRELLGTG